MRFAAAAALIAATQAVKTNSAQVAATQQDYSMEGLIAGGSNWYANVARPFLNENRDAVMAEAKRQVELEYGVLLDTCEAGTQCRLENERLIEEAIKAEWAKVMLSLRTDVDATMLKTKKLIKEGYDNAVVCQENDDCPGPGSDCTVREETYHNVVIQIDLNQLLEEEKWTQWYDLERRRLEIEAECPDVDYSVVYGQYRTYEI